MWYLNILYGQISSKDLEKAFILGVLCTSNKNANFAPYFLGKVIIIWKVLGENQNG